MAAAGLDRSAGVAAEGTQRPIFASSAQFRITPVVPDLTALLFPT